MHSCYGVMASNDASASQNLVEFQSIVITLSLGLSSWSGKTSVVGAGLTTHSCIRYPSLESLLACRARLLCCKLIATPTDFKLDRLHCTAKNESMHTLV